MARAPLGLLAVTLAALLSIGLALSGRADQTGAPATSRATPTDGAAVTGEPTTRAPQNRAVPRKAREVLEDVQKRSGEPPPGYVGGRSFENRERRLPRGTYREYDVNPRVRGENRGPERILIEQKTGKAYYTGDHYRTFVPIE